MTQDERLKRIQGHTPINSVVGTPRRKEVARSSRVMVGEAHNVVAMERLAFIKMHFHIARC